MTKIGTSVTGILFSVSSLPALFAGGWAVAGCYHPCGGEAACDDPERTGEAIEGLSSSTVKVESSCGGLAGVYCVTAHLKDGAKLKPFLASGPQPNGGTQDCRGWSNVFAEKTVQEFSQIDLTYDGYNIKNAKALVSGSFHNDYGKPAFPIKLKEGGWIATYGYECSASGGANSMRILWIRNSQGRVFIEPFSLSKFNDPASAPEAIVGLDPSFDKSATSYTGRNFVGATNPYNGGYGTVIFVIANASTGIKSSQAVSILKNKGCSDAQILQLDGSSVAQVSENNNGAWTHLISKSRQMPQVFGVFAF
jgi:hypothetical protein